MFTGIVTELGRVKSLRKRSGGLEIWVEIGALAKKSRIGDSISVCGVCLTVEEKKNKDARFFLSKETLQRSWLARLQLDQRVNLEPAARFGDPIGGHLVQGHVDGVGHITSVGAGPRPARSGVFKIQAPASLKPYLLYKSSISVDGISLTIASARGREFSVALIPLTLKKTNLQFKKNGDPVNLEADVIGKWVKQFARR